MHRNGIDSHFLTGSDILAICLHFRSLWPDDIESASRVLSREYTSGTRSETPTASWNVAIRLYILCFILYSDILVFFNGTQVNFRVFGGVRVRNFVSAIDLTIGFWHCELRYRSCAWFGGLSKSCVSVLLV